MTGDEKCWLCARITPQDLAKVIHSLPFTLSVQHELLVLSINAVKYAYLKNPTLFCGKTKARIIGGLIYFVVTHYLRMRVYKRELSVIFAKLGWVSDNSLSSCPYSIHLGTIEWSTVLEPDFFERFRMARACALINEQIEMLLKVTEGKK